MAHHKNRYLLIWIVECDFSASIRGSDLFESILSKIRLAFGHIKAAQISTSLSIKYFSPTTRTAILRIAREHQSFLRAGITLLSDVRGVGCSLATLHASGSINAIQRKVVDTDAKLLNLVSRRRVRPP